MHVVRFIDVSVSDFALFAVIRLGVLFRYGQGRAPSLRQYPPRPLSQSVTMVIGAVDSTIDELYVSCSK